MVGVLVFTWFVGVLEVEQGLPKCWMKNKSKNAIMKRHIK